MIHKRSTAIERSLKHILTNDSKVKNLRCNLQNISNHYAKNENSPPKHERGTPVTSLRATFKHT